MRGIEENGLLLALCGKRGNSRGPVGFSVGRALLYQFDRYEDTRSHLSTPIPHSPSLFFFFWTLSNSHLIPF